MKTLRTLLVIATILTAGFTTKVMAQTKATNTAGAEIVTPITLTKENSIEFGRMAVQTATGGTVVLTTGGGATANLGVSLLTGTTPKAGTFTVGGLPNYIYSIVLPDDITITEKAGKTATMKIDKLFAKSTSGDESHTAKGKLSASDGTEVFAVGGTLNIDPAQTVGVYEGSFDVTVNYN